MSSSSPPLLLQSLQEIQKFKKTFDLSVICFCTLADPACKNFFGAVSQIKQVLEKENSNVDVAFVDVDELTSGDDVVTPFKIRAIPTTTFFRKEAGETGRVENLDVEKLRVTVAAHLLSTSSSSPSSVSKKASTTNITNSTTEETEKKKHRSEIKIVNCYFGNLDSGNFVDVTDRVRSIVETGCSKHCIIYAQKEFLILSSSSPNTFENTENNKLRIVVDKSGCGRTFTICEGKQIDLGEALDFYYVQHSGRDEFDMKYMNDGDDDFTGFVNPYGGTPSFVPGGGGGGCGG